MKVFFPKSLSDLHRIQTDFPVFWWNFIVVGAESGHEDRPQQICQDLKQHLNHEFNMVVCGANGQIPYALLESWSQDYFRRHAYDPQKMKGYLSSMNSSLTLATFSGQKDFLSFLRFDPFQSWREFESKMMTQSLDSIEMVDGYFHIKGTTKIAIPVQFSQKPSMNLTKPIMDLLDKYQGQAFLMGVHGSAYRNEFQVKQDLQVVSVVTSVVFVIFLIYLVLKAGWTVLLLSLPVGLSIFMAAQAVVLIYGSVHGLTLSFGSGVIGLAMDYGLHGLLGKSSRQTWQSNFVGMLTTLCGVLILICSGIPLIRQMMVFSTLGLLIAFFIYYVLFKYFSDFFNTKKFKISLPYFKFSQVLILLVVVFGFVGFKNVHMNLDLKKMNLMSAQELEYSKLLFYKPGQVNETYMAINSFDQGNFFNKKYAEVSLAQGLSYQGLDALIPSPAVQKENKQTWVDKGCSSLQATMNLNQKKFYQPFLSQNCKGDDVLDPAGLLSREYSKQFVSGAEVLSVFYPSTEAHLEYLEKNIPEAKSIVKSLMSFSEVLHKELTWMIPLSLLLTFIILYIYYRKVILVFCAVFPFLVGMSLFFIMSFIFSIEIDLIAVLGLVMVFGFSIDYGVFSTDSFHYKFDSEEQDNVYTALSLASITNLLGFLPMIFATHPVLKQFGHALFFGTLGAYLGTIYGLKYYFNHYKEKAK